jgi:murein DD-endopeptidase MepM/ murein hydrolase activator NlpD
MKANAISSASSVQAGQRIIIPTYIYSQKAPISAPDNNPDTRAARATRGLVGEADPQSIVTPTKRPQQTAALRQPVVEENSNGLQPGYRQKPRASEESSETAVPDYSVVTGSVSSGATDTAGGGYTVRSGDTLSGIASRNGVKTTDLMRVNGLTGSVIRVGQVLRIPDGSPTYGPQPAVVGSKAGTVNQKAAPKRYVKPTVDETVTSSVDTAAPQRTGIDQFRWPVNGRVVSKFGELRKGEPNDGIDISVPEGTEVKAAENGIVIYSGNELQDFGNLVLIRHSDGYVTAYAHNRSNSVSKGAAVKRGQVIARSGRTGEATAPMLHFEVRKDSKPVDPVRYLGG